MRKLKFNWHLTIADNVILQGAYQFREKMFKLFLVKNISDQDINTFENEPENKSKSSIRFPFLSQIPYDISYGLVIL